MKDFSFADETIDLNRSQTYKLSIQIHLNGFSFSVLDSIRNKYSLLKHYDLSDKIRTEEKGKKIEHILQQDNYLQKPFQQTTCLCINPKSLIIPAPLFDERYIKKYFEFNQPMDELEELHYQYFNTIDSYNVFSIPNPISNALVSHFPKIQFYHHSFPLMNYHLNFIYQDKTSIGLNIYEDFIDILAINNKQLLFYNSFNFQKHEDILYYLLNVYQELNLDPSTQELMVSGTNFNHDSLKSELKQYIKKIHHIKPTKEYTYSYLFRKDLLFYFFNLFNLNLCV
ncbi:MAG: DUF3822 family protein [Bacteroidales bacterium]